MKRMKRNHWIAILAGGCALCLGGALLCGTNVEAFAATDYLAFVDVGASAAAKAADEALGLTETNASVATAGTVTAGDTLFSGYGEGSKYSFDVEAGTYQVAVALKAETGKMLTVGGQQVALPEGAEGNTVVSCTATATGALEVEYTGKLCGVLVAAENSKVLLTADYTPGQVVRYGALLSEELEGATGYYSDGSTAELPIVYDEIPAAGGVNVNFTTVDVTGTVEGTDLTVSRYITTMPDDLVYFINCGSTDTMDEKDPEEDTIDPFYAYNRTVFDYYGESLLNYGTPDQATDTEGSTWGIYTQYSPTAPGDATFPYNSLVWTDKVTDMGYWLTDLTPNGNYRIWVGTLSHWHGRGVDVTFNGQSAGKMQIASKSFYVFENIGADGAGKINFHMQGASTNEPCINFIAVQNMETEVAALPADVTGPSTVGMQDHTVTVQGATEGAKIQIYNAANPKQMLLEEMVDPEKIQNGNYTLDWGEPFEEISQFYVVQITGGGVGGALLVSVTDIQNFKATVSPEGYTTQGVTVTVEANAKSGIAKWSWQLGEYGEVHTTELYRPYAMRGSFSVTANGDYIIVITSGLGVTYSETVKIDTIDPSAPALTVTPSAKGWGKGNYNLNIAVNAVAPVTEYKLLRDGKEVTSADKVPEALTLTETGEYTVFVKTAAGQSATESFTVCDAPTLAAMEQTYANRTFRFRFGDSEDFTVASVEAFEFLYEETDEGETVVTVSKMTVVSNTVDIYGEGTYVFCVTAETGAAEFFGVTITAESFTAGKESGGCHSVAGIGSVFAAVCMAAGVFLVTRKKES